MFDGEGIGKKRWVERLCKLSKGIPDIPFGKPNLLMENSVFIAFQFFLQECTYISTQHNTTQHVFIKSMQQCSKRT
jgi:hypothetical protein